MAAANNNIEKTHISDRNMVHMGIIIVVGILASTLPQPQVLGRIPLQHLLKDTVHASREDTALFFLLCGLFWYIKPLAGILTDAFPLFGTRRRHYLLFSAVLAAASWCALGIVPHTYWALLGAAIIVNLFMVMMSTVIGAYLVEAGQALGATGRLTALRVFVQNFCTLVQGPLGGFLAGGSFLVASGTSAVFVLAMFPVAYIFLKESRQRSHTHESIHTAAMQLRKIGRSGHFWIALCFIGLFYFAPGFGTTLYYRQNDVLKFDQQFIGNLGIYAGGMGLLSALFYSQVIKRLSLRTMIYTGVFCGAAGTLFYLLYSGPTHAILIEAQNGFFFTLAELALLDLAARSTPSGCEGLGYGLILSIRNVALFGADYVGSRLADHGWEFAKLVFLNAGTTAIVLFLVPLIPKVLLASKDQAMPQSAEPSTPAA